MWEASNALAYMFVYVLALLISDLWNFWDNHTPLLMLARYKGRET